jgi:hypothetical protein
MNAAPDLDAIAAKLTAAQHRAVLAGGPNGPGYWPLLSALVDKGLVGSAGYRYVLTPLGQRLQRHLQEARLD